MTLPLIGTASVTLGDASVIWTGTALTDAICRPGAQVAINGFGYEVLSRTDTTHFELTRNFGEANNATAICHISQFTEETASIVNLASLVARVQAQISVVDKNSQGLFYTRIGVTGPADPAPGNLAVDDSDPPAITEIYIDNVDANGLSVTGLLEQFSAGTMLIIRSLASAAYVALQMGSDILDSSGFYRGSVSYIDHDGTIGDGEQVSVGWFRIGEGLDFDESGPFADRDAFDAEAAGFRYLSNDGDGDDLTGGVLFVKASSTSGDWGSGIPIQGPRGQRGWAPNYLPEADNITTPGTTRYVLKLTSYVGGEGSAPTDNVGLYLTLAGFTASIGAATDFRGAVGLQGNPGVDGVDGTDGADGANGTDPGILLIWDDGTADANPGAGVIRGNQPVLTSATSLYVSKTNRAGDDISAFLLALAVSTSVPRKGGITLTRSGGNAQTTFDLTGVTDATGYVKLAVSNGSGSSGFIDNNLVSFQFTATGNAGANGDGAFNGPASATAGNIMVFADSTGALGEDSGLALDDFIATANNGTDFADKHATHDNLSINGADIASATTVNLETATGAFVEVTGTTTTTVITLADGHQRLVRAAGAWPITVGASLTLNNGGASYTCAAGDLILFVADGSVVRGTIFPASGRAPQPPSDFTGDSGTGGVKGMVPAPAAGDAAASKYLKADGTWATLIIPPVAPQGRLTLTSGVPLPESDVTGAASIYYVPSCGIGVPVYSGTTFLNKSIASGLTLALDPTAGHAGYHQTASIFDLFAFDDAGTLRLGTGPLWQKSLAVTMTIASPAVVTWAAHGLADGTPIVFSTTGALPTGLTAGATYFIKSPTTNTFNVAATSGGVAINTSGTQSGVHTAVAASYLDRGTGTGTTEIEFYQGVPVNKNALTVRFGSASGNTVSVPARRATCLGSFYTTAAGQATDSKTRRLLSNAHNLAIRPMRKNDLGVSWPYSLSPYRQAHGDASNQLEFLNCLAGNIVSATVSVMVNSTGAGELAAMAIGLDSTTLPSLDCLTFYKFFATAITDTGTASYRGYPGIGRHTLVWLERGAATGIQTWYGTNNDTTEWRTGIIGEVLA